MQIFNNQNKNSIPQKSKESKKLFYEAVQKYNMELYSNAYNNIPGKENKENINALYKLETEGGSCFKCGKEWICVKKEKMGYKLIYYYPLCYCHFKCPLCGRSLHLEDLSGKLRDGCFKYNIFFKKTKKMINKSFTCYCGHKLYDEENKIKYWGLKYEKENHEYLNKIRRLNNIYFEYPDGSLMIERKA